MLLFPRRRAPSAVLPVLRLSATGAALTLALLASSALAQAQESPAEPVAARDPLATRPGEQDPAQAVQAIQSGAPAATDSQISFAADGASYNDADQTVSVIGNVVMRRGDQSIRADQVTWNRKSGEIVAQGNIRFVDADGNQLFTERLELTDEFKAGAMENMLYVLREGGRLAAQSGTRGEDGKVVLHNAAYSACAVEDSDGCPRQPSWRITAKRVEIGRASCRERV